ncbi:tRNA (adenosine(37)-N6)-threonylcarbamoyltransferase complex dimerization subunit type 1 TsaB [Hydrotalea sp.]|uniref:tRNA (adenosine(37)-N6)-threonylcarbamoyltransferase complex dimerization subunit type 1 TsaB n=1 Tax=Hydrotalea sp. TaxID=2881279 RepID=UPI003D0B99C5
MALILNIDTATELASVCLCYNTEILSIHFSSEQKNHAAFIQPAIQQIMQELNQNLENIDAIAVTGGPGSYTGLRVGLATAKGIAYALNKPLIIENTLKVMAQAALQECAELAQLHTIKPWLIAPMIEARRMEVFTAVFTPVLHTIMEPTAEVLTENSFNNLLKDNYILFFGSGSLKWKEMVQNSSAFFSEINYNAGHLGILAYQSFQNNRFENIAYSTPFYLKEFYNPKKIIK